MRKPEILKGDAKEFIDVISDLDNSLFIDAPNGYSVLKMQKFYSQPFKTEMIDEYFNIQAAEFEDGNGWFKVNDLSYSYGDGEYGEEISNCRTLEDFISDFNRISSTKLTWKD